MHRPEAGPSDHGAEIEALAVRWLDPGSPRPWGMLLSLLLPLLLWFVTSPVVILTEDPLDVFVPLNDAWRLVHGERMHLDLHTPVGMLYGHSHAWGLWWTGDARLLLWTATAWSLAVLLLAWLAGADRAPALAGLVGLGLASLAVASPLSLDAWRLGAWSHLALYNRIGWALAIVVLLAVFRPGPPPGLREGFGVGACLLALAFVKVTYFALAGGVLLLALVDRHDRRRWALTVGVGVWALLGLGWLLSPGVRGYVADLADAALVATSPTAPGMERLDRLGKVPGDVLANLPGLLLGLLGVGFVAREPRAGGLRRAAVFLVVIVAVMVVGNQAHDHRIPALLAVGLVQGSLLVDAATVSAVRRGRGLLLASALVAAPHLLLESMALLQHGVAARSPDATMPFLLDEGPLSTLHVPRSDVPDPASLADADASTFKDFGALASYLRAGAAEVRQLASQEDARVLTLGFTNPLAMALGRPTTPGALSWYDYGRTWTPETLHLDDLVGQTEVLAAPNAIAGIDADRLLSAAEAVFADAGCEGARPYRRREAFGWTFFVAEPGSPRARCVTLVPDLVDEAR